MDIMDAHTFNHISRLLASKKPLDKLLGIYSPSKLILFCRTTFTWIRQNDPTPINARDLFKELKEKFTEEEYPELWI